MSSADVVAHRPDQCGYFLTIETGPSSDRRYAGRTAQERRDERRARLLDAGLERFGTAGYAATTIEGLCAEASLNARYFYEQFRTREELLTAVYERHVDDVFDQVRAAVQDGGDPEAVVVAGLRAFVEATLADERRARINYVEVVGVSAALEDRRRRVDQDYIELITRETAGLPTVGARTAEERRGIAVALVGAIDGLVLDWMSGDRGQPRDSIVDTLLAVFGPVLGRG
jgi:AcrR family transcriptional regulator